MVKKSLVSHVFSFLSGIKFVPGLNSRLADNVGTCIWMAVVAVGSGARFHYVLQGPYDMYGVQTFANKITATIMILLLPAYTLLTYPLLNYAVGKTSDLVRKPDLPRPKNMATFTIMIILTLCVVFYSVYYIVQGYIVF